MSEFILNNVKIREALRTFLDQCVNDLLETSNETQIKNLLKTKLVFDDGESCYTVGTTIVIGSNFPFFDKDIPDLCYREIQAAIVHELAHNYLTNFEDYRKFVLNGPKKFGVSVNIAKTVANILEDYRIENTIYRFIPFGKKLFFTLRTKLINDIYSKRKQQISTAQEELNSILNSMLLIGYTEKYVPTSSTKVNQLLDLIEPQVIRAKYAKSTKEVLTYSEKIVEIIKKHYNEQYEIDEDIKAFLGKMTEKGTKNPFEDNSQSEVNNDQRGTQINQSNSSNGIEDITKNLNEAEMMEEIQSQYKRIIENIENEDITAQIINEYLLLEQSDVALEEIKFEDIKQIEAISKENVNTKNLKLIIEDKIDSRYSHTQYEKLKNTLRQEIEETVSQLMEIKETKENEYEEGLKYGEINREDLYKFAAYKENSVFKQSLENEESIDLEVMLLIDESGSNGAKVLNTKNQVQMERYKLNRMIAIFLHEILKEMRWRHTVWAFHTQNNNEVITPLLSPEESLSAKGFNFANIYAKGSNRDGYHIRIAGEYMASKSEGEKKLLIVLSDGQPSAPRYSGVQAIRDVQKAIEEVFEKNVSVIGVFSGDEIENKYFEKNEENPEGMYEKAIFLNNEKLFDFKNAFKEMLIEFYQSE